MASDSSDGAVVQLDSFSDAIAAHLAKNQLDAAGIPCFLGNVNRPYGPILGPVRLYVRAQDVQAAQDILHAQQTHMHAMPPPEDEATDLPESVVRCPRCHHTDVVCRQLPRPTDTLLTRLRLWLFATENPQCHCFQCGFEFELAAEIKVD